MRQLEALADGVMEAARALVREKARPAAQQSEQELLRQREKVARGLDRLEACAADGRCAATRSIWRPSPRPAPSPT